MLDGKYNLVIETKDGELNAVLDLMARFILALCSTSIFSRKAFAELLYAIRKALNTSSYILLLTPAQHPIRVQSSPTAHLPQ
ncbi:hypothetical protein FACS1894208_01490 [Clostridia bacterium]|nr:hypothetical protein FACS1894208_01490 [Clostridia bacterium]